MIDGLQTLQSIGVAEWAEEVPFPGLTILNKIPDSLNMSTCLVNHESDEILRRRVSRTTSAARSAATGITGFMAGRKVKTAVMRYILQPPRFACRLLLTVCVAGCLSLNAGIANAQDAPQLLEQIGAVLRDVVQPPNDVVVVEEEEEELAVPQLLVDVPAPAVPEVVRAADEITARRKRLDAWCQVKEDWLAAESELTPEQRLRLKKLLTKEAALNQQRWKRQENEGRVLPDTMVILFGGTLGPTRRVHRGILRDFIGRLPQEQRRRYAEVSQRRRDRITDWFAERAACVVSSELYLTDEQLAACTEEMKKQTRRPSNGLYAFHQQTHYLPYHSIESLQPRLDALTLTEIQQRRLTDLVAASKNNSQLMVAINGGEKEHNEDVLNGFARKAKQRMLTAAAVRTEYITTRLQLPPQEARHLQVAGKGVTIRHLNTWKKQTRAQLQQFAQNPRFGLGMTIHLAGPGAALFEHDRIWQQAVRKVCEATNSKLIRTWSQRERQGATAFVMATLDRELMLRESQVEGLQRLIEASEPHQVGKPQEMLLELAMLARTLVRVDEADLRDVLSESQLECWEQMKRQFRYQNNTRTAVPTRNGEVWLGLEGRQLRGSHAPRGRIF